MTVDQQLGRKPFERLSAHIGGIVQYGPSGDPTLQIKVGAVRSGKASNLTALIGVAKCSHYVPRGE